MKFGLIGHPVAHSLSPVIHAAAYRQLGVEHEYVLFDAATEADVDRIADAVRSGELAGVNITIPWKRRAFALAERRSGLAERLQVANVLARRDGVLEAHNTDALALESEFKSRSSTRSALVLGSGGATPAVVAACQAAGIDEVYLTARRFDAAQPQTAWPAAEELARLGAKLLAWPTDGATRDAFEARASQSGLVVQCTSAGMQGADSGEAIAKLIPWSALPADALAYDLIYAPLETPFLRRARESGRRAVHGLHMLVGQAAHAIEIWLGVRPDPEPLLAAALAELAKRGRA